MSPLTHRPFAAVAAMSWGTALRTERERAPGQPTVRQMADVCGVSRTTYEAWEAGEDHPTPQQLKRVHARLSRMFAHDELYRRETAFAEPEARTRPPMPEDLRGKAPPPDLPPAVVVRSSEVYRAPARESVQLTVTPAPDMPDSVQVTAGPVDESEDLHGMESLFPDGARPRRFRDALRMAREEVGMSQVEIGQLLGVDGTAVGHWERGVAVPIRLHYDRLVELFEALRKGPRPRSMRDIEKPSGKSGAKAEGPITADEPVAAAAPPPGKTLEEAAVVYARALAAQRAAEGACDRARAELAAREAELAARAADTDAAKQLLDETIAGGA